MSDQPKPRVPRRSPSSQSIPVVTSAPPAALRGTQQTKLRADGRSVLSTFRGKLDERLMDMAGNSACSILNGSELIWVLDLLHVPSFEGNLHQTLSKLMEAFQKEGGRQIIVAIPETMERYRILRSSIASLGLRHRIDIHHATNADELSKLVVERLKR